jgi:integrase
MRRRDQRVQHRLRLPRLRVHELRHSAVTLAIHEGVPMSEVSAQLGHSSQRTTLGIYSQVFIGGSAYSASMSKVIKREMQGEALRPP